MTSEIKFPLYRKLRNGKSVYLIESHRIMTELQMLGSKVLKHELNAKILPERLLIHDIIHNEGGSWEEISKEEYREWEQKALPQ